MGIWNYCGFYDFFIVVTSILVINNLIFELVKLIEITIQNINTSYRRKLKLDYIKYMS